MSPSNQQDDPDSFVTIGRHRIGPTTPTFIVAEAGVNHNGSLKTALRLVDAAADAGADAVKFQMFQAANLVTASAPTAQYQKIGCGEVSQSAMLRRLELTRHQFESVQKRCDQRSILFMASPFGEADVGRLSAMGVPVIKIAYYLQVLRKGQEAIALDHVVPLRILFPQSNADTSPYVSVDLSTWRKKVEYEIRMWRQDPNRVSIMPVPVGIA